jgi:hypothetical protein
VPRAAHVRLSSACVAAAAGGVAGVLEAAADVGQW